MKDRQLPELSEVASEAEEELSTRSYCVESTRARLTLQNAKAHLYHFCAVSSNHAGRYVDVRPVLETRNNGGANAWTARITLPSFVHPRVRTAMSSKGYASEGTAVKDAAFEAYTALHKEGLVNDNLLPFANEYVPEVGQAHMDQPSLMQIALRESAWATFSEVSRQCDDNVQWHKHSLPVRDGEKEVIAVRLYLPAVLLHGLEFELYWNREITYTVDIHPVGDVLAISHIETARQYTHAILSSVSMICIYESIQTADFLQGARGSDVGFQRLFLPAVSTRRNVQPIRPLWPIPSLETHRGFCHCSSLHSPHE